MQIAIPTQGRQLPRALLQEAFEDLYWPAISAISAPVLRAWEESCSCHLEARAHCRPWLLGSGEARVETNRAKHREAPEA